MEKLELNKEKEVNLLQYNIAKRAFAGLLAHRKEENKYFIKPLIFMGQKKLIVKMLNL